MADFSYIRFLDQQLSLWSLANNNYRALQMVQRRTISLKGVNVHLQYNPHRILSSAAKVDSASIEARKCFLCPNHLPLEQLRHPINHEMVLLVNPYPIFPQHFTIPTLNHQPQRIAKALATLLDLIKSFPNLLWFYNGPRCGASAPDHLHFQAGNRGFLPIEEDFESGKWVEEYYVSPDITIWKWHDYHRSIISFQGANKETFLKAFNRLYEVMANRQSSNDEPMMNLLGYFHNQQWILHIILRDRHRPWQFDKTDEKQIVISPASVDLGGVVILPREIDFKRMNEETLSDIFHQVCTPEKETDILLKQMLEKFISH